MQTTVGLMMPPLEEPPLGPPYPDPYPPPTMPFPNPLPNPGMLKPPPGPKNPPGPPAAAPPLLLLLSLEWLIRSGLDAGRVAKEGEAMRSRVKKKRKVFMFFVCGVEMNEIFLEVEFVGYGCDDERVKMGRGIYINV